jgi:hypothetical protein
LPITVPVTKPPVNNGPVYIRAAVPTCQPVRDQRAGERGEQAGSFGGR